MVTVASEVTVPSALRLTPISPLVTVSGTIDIGAALRAFPPDCGAAPCRVHQTAPPTTSTTRTAIHAPRRRGLRATTSGAAIGGPSFRALIGWFIKAPSQDPYSCGGSANW